VAQALACDRHDRLKPVLRTRRGVTLIELLIVTAIMGLLAGLAFPSAAAGIESLRLRSTADSVVNLLNTAIDRAERRQQVIEIWISAQDNVVIARTPDLGFARRLDMPGNFHITAITPVLQTAPSEPRRFLLYPGGTVPRLGIEITSNGGRKRVVTVDPLTGMPHSGEPR
jgi:prepilin-type N-terminal cleavage/methylation domain-containing protein